MSQVWLYDLWRMWMTSKFHGVLMDSAFLWANLSTCNRRQVGCVITKDARILATGYNGTISGMDNCCEYKWCTNCDLEFDNCECVVYLGDTKTKDTVLHAEQNALMFALKQGISTKNATLYCTDAPCVTCSKLIAQAGITKVYYNREYNDSNGINLLTSVGVEVKQLENE